MKLTHEDYAALPHDGLRHEIIDGVLVAHPSSSFSHQLVVTALLVSLLRHVDEHDAGWVVSYTRVLLDEHTIVAPDGIFISKARVSIITEYVEGPPDLVIEVLSPSNRDYDELRLMC